MEKEKFSQLMLLDGEASPEILPEQREFLELHKQIMYCGNMAGVYAVQLAKSLKRMKDGKHYEAAGFESFGDYAENACGIRERQAYNYVKAVESLSDEFLQSNAKLGITKLAILAAAPEEDRETLVESGAAEDSTAKELQERIKELEAERDAAQEQISFLQVEKDAKFSADTGAADKAQKALEKERKVISKLTEEKTKLEKEVQDLKNLPPKVEQVDNPETVSALEQAKADLAAAQSALDIVNKKLEIASDQNMARFKVKFEDFQRILDESIAITANLDVEKKEKCINALKTIIKERGLA